MKAERSEIHLPEEAPWLDDFVTELASFTGLNDPADDQVDALAYAALASINFRPSHGDGGACVLLPGRGNPFEEVFAPRQRTGALGHGAELNIDRGGYFGLTTWRMGSRDGSSGIRAF